MPARRRACEACRRLKVQCTYENLQSTTCKRCSKVGRHCAVTERRRRTTNKPKVAELERKLEEMSASLDAIKSQSSLRDGQSEQLPTPNVPALASSSSVSHSNSMNPFDHGKGRMTGSHVQGSHTPEGSKSSREIDTLDRDHPSASSATDYTARLPLLNHSDVIERGVITMDAARRALDFFVVNMLPQFPIVVVKASNDAERMRRDTPTLFLAILCAASGTLCIGAQREINKELQRVIADRVLVIGERSLDLIQALQVTTVWYYPPDRYEELKFYQLVCRLSLFKVSLLTFGNFKIHITCVMAIEMGLSCRRKAKKLTGLIETKNGFPLLRKPYPDSKVVECRRAWLGCYFLAAQ